MRTTTAQKNYISGSLNTSLCGSLRFGFFALKFVNRKTIKCFSMKPNKYWERFCYYILVVPTTLEKVVSRSNFSDNSVLLLFLLLFFAVVTVSPPSMLKASNFLTLENTWKTPSILIDYAPWALQFMWTFTKYLDFAIFFHKRIEWIREFKQWRR